MFNGSNRDQNSQHSGILTEPLNPLDYEIGISILWRVTLNYLFV